MWWCAGKTLQSVIENIWKLQRVPQNSFHFGFPDNIEEEQNWIFFPENLHANKKHVLILLLWWICCRKPVKISNKKQRLDHQRWKLPPPNEIDELEIVDGVSYSYLWFQCLLQVFIFRHHQKILKKYLTKTKTFIVKYHVTVSNCLLCLALLAFLSISTILGQVFMVSFVLPGDLCNAFLV